MISDIMDYFPLVMTSHHRPDSQAGGLWALKFWFRVAGLSGFS